jgi:hypothetical protein
MDLRTCLFRVADRYCGALNISRPRLATLLVNDGKFFDRVAAGGGFTARTYERSLRWFSDHWPNDTPWPEGISRPTPHEMAEDSIGEKAC